jgi:hypothetical protein
MDQDPTAHSISQTSQHFNTAAKAYGKAFLETARAANDSELFSIIKGKPGMINVLLDCHDPVLYKKVPALVKNLLSPNKTHLDDKYAHITELVFKNQNLVDWSGNSTHPKKYVISLSDENDLFNDFIENHMYLWDSSPSNNITKRIKTLTLWSDLIETHVPEIKRGSPNANLILQNWMTITMHLGKKMSINSIKNKASLNTVLNEYRFECIFDSILTQFNFGKVGADRLGGLLDMIEDDKTYQSLVLLGVVDVHTTHRDLASLIHNILHGSRYTLDEKRSILLQVVERPNCWRIVNENYNDVFNFDDVLDWYLNNFRNDERLKDAITKGRKNKL